MLVIIDQSRRMPRPVDFSCFQVKAACNPAVFQIIYKIPIVSHFKNSVQNMGNAFFHQRYNPQAI